MVRLFGCNGKIMNKNRFYCTTNIFLCLTIFLWANVFLLPKASRGAEQSFVSNEIMKQKIPARALQELAAGNSQDLIVEFEHQDIRGEAAVRRQARRLRFNDDRIVAFKAARFRDRKKLIFDADLDSEFKLIQDYKHLPLAFIRVNSQKAAERLGSLPEVKSLHVNQRF